MAMEAERRPFWPDRRWWAALLVIVVVAAGLRYTGYNFSLPYVDHPDEPDYNIAARMVIDFGSPKPIGMQGYPPGIIAVHYVLLRLFHDPATPPSTILPAARLIGITFSVATVVVLALLGYRIGPAMTGLVAAALWAMAPIVVEHSRFATADSFVTFFSMLTFFLVLSGTLYDRDAWTTAGMVAVMLAIVFKYQAVFFLPLVWAFPLLRFFWLERTARRRLLKNAVVNTLNLVVFFFWLIVLFPALEAGDSPNFSASPNVLGIPSTTVLLHNFLETIDKLGGLALWWAGLLGLLWMFCRTVRQQIDLLNVVAVTLGALMWLFGVSLYGEQDIRQFFGMGALLTLLRALGLILWGEALRHSIEIIVRRRDWSVPDKWRKVLPNALTLALMAPVILTDFPAAIANAYEHTLPDRRNDLATWMDVSLPPGGYVAPRENHKTFNGPWGGYSGIHEYPLVEMALYPERSIEEWRTLGAVYAIVNYDVYQEMVAAHHPDLEQMLLVKSYPPDTRYRGPSMVVFRLYPIQHAAEGQLGPIALVGYDLSTAQVRPGETVDFTLYWQATAPTEGDYVVYNHLVPLDSREVVAQVDGPPLFDERRGTSQWDDPEETLVSRVYSLTVGEEVPPGEYRLITGFYRRETGERLLAPDGADFLLVTTIEVIG